MEGQQIKVLVLGASGMLGSAMFCYFGEQPDVQGYGTVRDATAAQLLPSRLRTKLIEHADVTDTTSLMELVQRLQPAVIINCIGVVKQLSDASDPLVSIPINSLLPHQLAAIAQQVDARLVHVSTDCVFSGSKGSYLESDVADADDLYGRSKLLGEVSRAPGITLRTSIVGPELRRGSGLLAWFLAQKGKVSGFSRAFFSGLTTDELARVVHNRVLPDPELVGLYHVSSDRISKLDLLQIFAKSYDIDIEIESNSQLEIDRSLDSARFKKMTGYSAPSWPDMVQEMVITNERWRSS